MQISSTHQNQGASLITGGNEQLTSVTKKGQITLPIEIRRSLGIGEGDKVAVTMVQSSEGKQPQLMLKPVRSVAEMTYGAVSVSGSPLRKPADFKQIRRAFEEGIAQDVMAETPTPSPSPSSYKSG